MPLYGHDVGLPASLIGMVVGAYALAAFAVRLVLPALLRRIAAVQPMSANLVAAGMFALFPLIGTAWVFLGASFLVGLALGVGVPLSMVVTVDAAPVGHAGQVAGLRVVANNAIRIGVPLLAGGVGTALGGAAVFWINAVTLAAAGYLSRR